VQGELGSKLYVWNNHLPLTFDLVKRAKDAGYHALVVTIDGAGRNREYNSRESVYGSHGITPKLPGCTQATSLIKNVMLKSLFANGVPHLPITRKEFRATSWAAVRAPEHGGARKSSGWQRFAAPSANQWDCPLMSRYLESKDALTAVDACQWHRRSNMAVAPSILRFRRSNALPGRRRKRLIQMHVLMDSGIRRAATLSRHWLSERRPFHYRRATPIWAQRSRTEGCPPCVDDSQIRDEPGV